MGQELLLRYHPNSSKDALIHILCTVCCNGQPPSFLLVFFRIALPSPFTVLSAAALPPSAALYPLPVRLLTLGHRFSLFINIAPTIKNVNIFLRQKTAEQKPFCRFHFILHLWLQSRSRDQCQWVAIPIQPLHFHLVLKHRQVRTNHKTAPRSRTVPG